MVETARHRVNGILLSVTSRMPERSVHTPVVLVPGTGATAADWDIVAEDLSLDRTVHALDLRGHGQSEWPGTYSIELMAQDLVGLIAKMAGEVDIIGHSLGGLVACRALAADDPPAVRRLVLEDVGLPRPRVLARPARPEGKLDFDWAMVEQIRSEIDRPAAHWPDTLSRVAPRTLAISGGPGSFLPGEQVTDLVALVQRGSHLTIEAGHEIHAAQPAEFMRAVRAFLDT